MTPVSAILAVFVLVAGFPVAARAQAQDESAIVGTVSDATGAVVPNVTVTVSGPSLIGGPRSAATRSRGEFRVPLLTAGTYEIMATSASFAVTRRSGIVVPANTTVTVDLRLELGSVRSEIAVLAASPMLDVRSSSSPTAVDQAMLQHLPTNRVLADLLNLAPGVSKAAAPGAPDNIAFAGTQGSNAVLVDGITATEARTGAVRVTPNYNWIAQAQVVAIGADAEYGRTTGAILDAAIRSGSNRVSGLGEYRMTLPAWVGDNTRNPAFAPRAIRTSWDADAQIGGTLRHDRIWFFGGVAYSDLADRPAGLSGSDYTRARNPGGILKIDAAIRSNLRIDGIFSVDRQRTLNGGLSPSYPTSVVAQRMRQMTWVGGGRVRWIEGPRTTAEVHLRGYTSPDAFGSQLPDGDAGPPSHFDYLSGTYSQNTSGFGTRDRRVATIGGSLTHYADAFLHGSHELKFGAELDRTRTADVDGIPGGRVFYDYGHAPYLAVFDGGSDVNASGRETSLYVQDAWRLGVVTLSPGLRIDINRGSVPAAGTIFSTTPVSPRLGLAWDVTRDHRTAVKAHYGLYADPLYTNLYSFKDTAGANPTIIARVTGPDQFVEIERDERYNASIDPRLAPPHVAQAFVGIDREIAPDATIEARYIARRFRDFIGNIDTGSTWVPVSRTDPGADNLPGTPDDGATLTLYRLTNPGQRSLLVTNPAAARRKYDAVQVIGRKRYSHGWQVLAGYTRARTSGTAGSGGTFANAFLDRFDFAWYGPFADPNRLVNKDAPFTSTEVKIAGTYSVSRLGGANLSAVVRIVSGAPVRRTAQFRGLIGGLETVIVDPANSAFLAPRRTLDMRIDKLVRLSRGALGIVVDVFNVTNQGIATSVVAQSGARFGTPLTWSDPRTARAGIRWTF